MELAVMLGIASGILLMLLVNGLASWRSARHHERDIELD